MKFCVTVICEIPDLVGDDVYVRLYAILVLVPALDLDVVDGHCAEGTDEGGGQTCVGDKRNVEVDGSAAYIVAVGELLV